MKKLNFFLIILTIIVFFDSCAKNENPTPTPPMPVEVFDNVKDVYTCGYEKQGDHHIATYWKNSVPTNITSSPNDAELNDICVIGDDVYVCGFENFDGVYTAKYWKNGVPTILSSNATATGIIVVGNDVHVCGYSNVGTSSQKALYWKNNANNVFVLGDLGSYASAICNQGNDIYISGINNRAAVYWKNNLETRLGVIATNESIFNNSTSIQVVGTDVYSGGEAGGDKAGYWKNLDYISLSSAYSFVTGIESIGNDVYTCGVGVIPNSQTPFAIMWKNSQYIPLSGTNSRATGIKVAVSNAYVSGFDLFSGNIRVCYWKNGIKYFLGATVGVTEQS